MTRQPLFAIVRFEESDAATTPIELRVTVTGVVEDASFGRDEVKRLNQLNSEKGCRYFLQATRLKRPGEKHE